MPAKAKHPSKASQLLATRLAVIQTLYSIHMSAEPHTQTVAWLNEEQHQGVDEKLYQKLRQLATSRHDEIVALLLSALEQRQWKTIDVTAQCLLICGCAEMLGQLNDNALIISLYCRISDAFFEEHIGKFVNGVLQNCAGKIEQQELHAAGLAVMALGRQDGWLAEDALIAKYFAPLAAQESFQLQDDGACLPDLPTGSEWVMSTDSIASDVHLPHDTPLDIIAEHLSLTNLSDIAAMAATAKYFLLNLAFSAQHQESDVAQFAQGIARIAQTYSITLLGGDSIKLHPSQKSAWLFSATMIGVRNSECRMLRTAARQGDILALTGTVGDAALGLALLQYPEIAKTFRSENVTALKNRYYLPTPRLAEARRAAKMIHALMDVSDGVCLDSVRMAKASQKGVEIFLETLPCSAAASEILKTEPSWRRSWRIGGGDYELLMSLPVENFEDLRGALDPLPVTMIGRFDNSGKIRVTENGKIVNDFQGFDHFS